MIRRARVHVFGGVCVCVCVWDIDGGVNKVRETPGSNNNTTLWRGDILTSWCTMAVGSAAAWTVHATAQQRWSMVITQAREECLFSRVSGEVTEHILKEVN